MEAAFDRRGRRLEQERAFAGDLWQESGLVFTSTTCTAMDRGNFYSRYVDILREADLEGRMCYDLRRSAATTIAAGTIDAGLPYDFGRYLAYDQAG